MRVVILLLSASVVACTFLSGVESLEVGSDAAPEAGAPEGGSFFFRDGAAPTPEASTPSANTCGAQGEWTECVADSLVSCATECSRRGKTCVESCCATDEQGQYPARVGAIWPVSLSSTCSEPSVDARTEKGFLCNDPMLPLGLQVRCCCR